jgi:hypothetical protein
MHNFFVKIKLQIIQEEVFFIKGIQTLAFFSHFSYIINVEKLFTKQRHG